MGEKKIHVGWKFAAQLVFEILQWLLMGVALVLSAPRWLLLNVDRLWLQHVYYAVVKMKRRVLGEELWQEHDVKIGVSPPAGHPWWNQILAAPVIAPPVRDTRVVSVPLDRSSGDEEESRSPPE